LDVFSFVIGSLVATAIDNNNRTTVPTGTPTGPDAGVKDPYLLQNSSIICNNSDDNVEPEFIYISPTVIKCISQKHIYWNVLFHPGPAPNGFGSIPYQIESEYKRCVGTNQIEQKASKETYFESTLEFKTDLADSKVEVITLRRFRCFSKWLNKTLAATWVSYVKPNGTVNLTEGRKEKNVQGITRQGKQMWTPANYPSEFEDCIDVIQLVSNVSRNKHACFDNTNNKSNSSPVQYLKCTSWSNCQQLVRHVFQGNRICQERSDPPDCDTNPRFCEDLRNSTDSGIIFCKEGNGRVRILPFLKTVDTEDEPQSLNLITDVARFERRTVRLTVCSNLTTFSCQHKFAFRCKALKFLAVKGFEWINEYKKPRNFSAACQLEREDTDEYYIEKCSYEIPPGYSNASIDVECKVYFQSGRIVSNFPEQTYTPIPRNANPHKQTSKEVLIGAAVGITVSLVFLVPILIYCSCKIRRQKKKLYFPADEADKFVKGSKMTNDLGPSEAQSAIVLPYDVSLEIQRENIKIEPTILGKGAFGANTERIRKQDVYLIFEFCQNGNVLEFIRKKREQFVDQLSYREDSETHVFDKIDNTV
ncbi:unnamed protein product, partial [Allacma fusca]